MEEKILKHLKNWVKKNYKFLLVILIYFLYQANFLISILASFNVKLSSFPRNLKMMVLFINDLIYVFTLLFMFKKEIKNGLKKLKKNFSSCAILSLNCWIIGSLIMTLSSLIISIISKQDISGNESLVRESIKLAPIYMLFSCSIVAPVLEEMTFRRALNGLIKNKWIFIILSGVIFGLLHIIGSYKSPMDLLYIIPYGSMGCAFAYLLSKTDNITLPIIIHMMHNTILVLMQIIRG